MPIKDAANHNQLPGGESQSANPSVCAHHTLQATVREEGVIEPIKWMRSPHTATGGEDESVH